ncbi:MAG: hypothetical protein KBT45_05620 [Bacteroidales bacterium]|nr:hypothetical protein [Candidatus Colimorpha pelethequi]
MSLFPQKLIRAHGGELVFIQSFPMNSMLGVLNASDTNYNLSNYISLGYPGMGFYVHSTDSHSYHNYCRDMREASAPSYKKMLKNKNFSYSKTRKEAKRLYNLESAKTQTDNTKISKDQILYSYINCLKVAERAEYEERVYLALRKKSRLFGSNRKLQDSSQHHRRVMASMAHEMRTAQIDLTTIYSPELLERYHKMASAFESMFKCCRRIWDLTTHNVEGHHHAHVYFDMGVFDFVQIPGYVPLMNDGKGVHYFIMPEHIVVARTATDFDMVPLKDVSFIFHIARTEPQSEFAVPELGLSFRFSKFDPIKDFVEEINRYKETL